MAGMIQATITYTCTHCASPNLVKNGHNANGKQQYRCKDCGKIGLPCAVGHARSWRLRSGIGDRSEQTCGKLWEGLPAGYRRCHSYSDFWAAYRLVFSEETHRWGAKRQVRPILWNVGTTPCGNPMHAMCARRYRFLSRTSITRSSLASSLSGII